jgi:hypothetical protein
MTPVATRPASLIQGQPGVPASSTTFNPFPPGFSHSGAARTPPPALRSSLSAHRPRGPSDGQVKVGTQRERASPRKHTYHLIYNLARRGESLASPRASPRALSPSRHKVGTQPGEGLPMAPPIFKTICETSFSTSAIFGKYACRMAPPHLAASVVRSVCVPSWSAWSGGGKYTYQDFSSESSRGPESVERVERRWLRRSQAAKYTRGCVGPGLPERRRCRRAGM